MAFDITSPADLALLRSEEADDPIGMGYKKMVKPTGTPPRHNGDMGDLLRRFNNPSMNVGGETANRQVEELDISDIAAVIDATEYNVLSDYDQEWVKMFINRPEDSPLKPYRDKFLQLFAGGSVTRVAVLALRSRLASRVEVLFEVNTVITPGDWIAVENS